MNVRIDKRDGVSVVSLDGRLDGFGAKEAAEILPGLAKGALVVLDCR